MGDQWLEVKPLTLENSLRLVLLLAPYAGRMIQHWDKVKGNPRLLETVLRELKGELAFAPGDLITAFALCLSVEPEFIARNASGADLVNALPVLDRINDFRALWQACEALDLIK